MIDKRIGIRIKQRREALGMTQESFAQLLGVTSNYVSTIERGASFPRCERLIQMINALQTTADALFCDVIEMDAPYIGSVFTEQISELPVEEQQRLYHLIELIVSDAITRNRK